MGEERRRHDRSSNKQAQVACTSPEYTQPGSPSYNLAVQLLDTSATGACLITTDRLREGCPVILGIIPPGQKNGVMAKGSVRWSTSIQAKGRTAHVAGIEFDKPVAALAPSLPKSGPSKHAEPNRRHKRFMPEKVDIVCLPPGFLSKLGMRSNISKALKDLSMGGAQIVSTEKLDAGERVDLLLKFAFPKTSVRAAAVVRWCRRDTLAREPRWIVGVVFKELDPGTQSRLRTVEAVYIDATR